MTKADVLAGARGKPTVFEFEEFKCLLRPLTFGERRKLFDMPGLEVEQSLFLWAVSDGAGNRLLAEDDLADFALPVFNAVVSEVARRNGLDGKTSGEPGKEESPTGN